MITVGVDFDGTLVNQDEDGVFRVVPGAAESVRELRDAGCRIVIHTCRTTIALADGTLAGTLREIAAVLKSFDIPFDEIHKGAKLVADIYVDDRAVPFEGRWGDTLAAVMTRVRRLED